MAEMKVKRLADGAKLPTYADEGAAGLDLYALEDAEVSYTGLTTVRTGVAVEIPVGHVGVLAIRSGLAAKYGLTLANGIGVIDSSYRGEVKAIVTSVSLAYAIKAGERFAQLVVVPYARVEPTEAAELSDTSRGASGFGSTGAT